MMARPWLFALLLTIASSSRATQTPAVGALAETADAVVLTSCDGGVSQWTGDPAIIVTRHQCRVERAFKGQPGDSVTVQVLGGRVGDVTMEASTGWSVPPGVDAVLMLRRSRFGAYYVIAGGAEGVLPVAGARERRTVSGMSLDAFNRLVNE